MLYFFFFFFQAEDGIRDKLVTGVQTCALPIFPRQASPVKRERVGADATSGGQYERGRPGEKPASGVGQTVEAVGASFPRLAASFSIGGKDSGRVNERSGTSLPVFNASASMVTA